MVPSTEASAISFRSMPCGRIIYAYISVVMKWWGRAHHDSDQAVEEPGIIFEPLRIWNGGIFLKHILSIAYNFWRVFRFAFIKHCSWDIAQYRAYQRLIRTIAIHAPPAGKLPQKDNVFFRCIIGKKSIWRFFFFFFLIVLQIIQ